MKILIASWRGPGHRLAGGAEQVMHEHAKAWVKAGHEVTLFTSHYSSEAREQTIDGVKIIRAGYHYWGVQFCFFGYYWQHRQQYDLVVDQFHGIPFFTPLYVSKPILAVIQETTREVWWLNPLPVPLNWIVALVGFMFEPFVFVLYKHIPFMTGSNSGKQDLMAMGINPSRITIVPHGLVIPQVQPAAKERVFTVCYLGVLSQDKGIEDAVRCFAILRKRGKYQFWVIGRFESVSYEKRIKQLVKSLGLEQAIKFWGFVDQEQKFRLLSAAQVLVNPSAREGWGLVNLEANYMATPVVGYNVAGTKDSVVDQVTGLLVKKGDFLGMAEQIEKLAKDKKLYEKMCQRAKIWSRKYNWTTSTQQSLKLVESVYGKQA